MGCEYTSDLPVIISGPFPLPVTGTITPSGTQDVNIVSSIDLSVNILNSSLAVTGPLTDSQLRASSVPVSISGSIPVTQNTSPWIISGTVTTIPSGTQDVNLIGTSIIQPVSQSGSWTVSLATESIEIGTVDQGHPNAGGSESWPVSVSNFPSTVAVTQNTNPWIVNGSGFTQPISAISLPLPNGAATETTLSGIKTDTDKFTFSSTRLLIDGSGVTQPISGTIIANQGTSPWIVSGAITTSPNVNVHDGTGTSISSTGSSLNVDVTNTVPVTGTFFQATQPVSGVGNFTVVQPTGTNLHTVIDSGIITSITNALPSGTNVIGHVITDNGSVTNINNSSGASAVNIQDGGNSITVDGTIAVSNFPATQTISGTVTANAGTNLNTSALALDTTLTNGTQKTKIIDTGGVNAASVDAAGDVQVDVNNFPASQTINGTVTATQTTGTNLHTVIDNFPATQAVTQSGAWTVTSIPSDGNKTTYSAAVVGFASASLATDIWTITGSATKVVRITRIELTGTTTTAAGISLNVQLIRRSSANTGGTTVTDIAVPHDTNNAAATASVVHYTANPSVLGTAVGPIRSDRDTFVAVGNDTFEAIWEFGNRPAQAIVLRGTSQILAINLGGVTVMGSAIDINVEWTEE